MPHQHRADIYTHAPFPLSAFPKKAPADEFSSRITLAGILIVMP